MKTQDHYEYYLEHLRKDGQPFRHPEIRRLFSPARIHKVRLIFEDEILQNIEKVEKVIKHE